MGTALKFVRVRTIDQIPRHLFEQVKPREFDIDRLYEFAPVLLKNPLNLMGAFVTKEGEIKGVMWATFNVIANSIMVNVLSIAKEYFGRGIVREANGILRKQQKVLGATRVVFTTTRPRAFERFGYRKSKRVVMEM